VLLAMASSRGVVRSFVVLPCRFDDCGLPGRGASGV